MDINRNNYHIWISDFHEGSLSPLQKKMLNNFLDLNPDLRNEFNDYGEFVLHPDISIRIEKSTLKKDYSDLGPEVLEQYAIAIVENDFNLETPDEISLALQSSEAGENLINEYRKIRLFPEEISYPGKLTLKRIPFRAGIIGAAIRVLSVAASVALIVSLFLIIPEKTNPPVKYNTAYLLPFNSSEYENREASDLLFARLSHDRIPLKSINIKEEEPTASADNEDIRRVDLRVTRATLLNNVVVSDNSLSAGLNNVTPAIIESMPPVNENLSPRQFIAMNLRKHILKEDEDNTDKIKPHEVADLTVDGLNKLLGWEMLFEKEKTEDGRLSGFKFTSHLINLDHKVKNVTDDL